MLPITGPVTRVKANSQVWWERIVWYRQRRPYDLPLTLDHEQAFWVSSREPALSVSPEALWARDIWRAYHVSATKAAFNKAYSRFIDKIGDQAGIGIDLAQYRQANQMIENRANKLISFTRALVGRSPLGVARSLGIAAKRAQAVMKTRHGTSRTLADLWLEFHFGWKPLVQDIYAAGEVLSEPLKSTRVKASATLPFTTHYGSGSPASSYFDITAKARVRFGADIEVINPNLRLLQQLGILNPAVVLVDAVPWSFVLGWFHSFQEYLSSFTDFAGLRLHKLYVVRDFSGTIVESWYACDPHEPTCTPAASFLYTNTAKTHWCRKRTRDPLTDVPRPYWMWKGISRLSPTRGLTAISLLTQQILPLERFAAAPIKFAPKGSNIHLTRTRT